MKRLDEEFNEMNKGIVVSWKKKRYQLTFRTYMNIAHEINRNYGRGYYETLRRYSAY